MATRFYLPISGAAAVSPAFSASWDNTTGADRIAAVVAKSNTAVTAKSVSETTTSVHNFLHRQYVSEPLVGNQAISGTIKGVILADESVSGADACPQLTARVVSNDGSVVRGTLIDVINTALSNEFIPSGIDTNVAKFPRNWSGAGASVTTVNALDGDRLVFELGARFTNTSALSRTVRIFFGDATSGADCSEIEGDFIASPPQTGWIEVSTTLDFTGGGGGFQTAWARNSNVMIGNHA